jgi:hypothetical protein
VLAHASTKALVLLVKLKILEAVVIVEHCSKLVKAIANMALLNALIKVLAALDKQKHKHKIAEQAIAELNQAQEHVAHHVAGVLGVLGAVVL